MNGEYTPTEADVRWLARSYRADLNLACLALAGTHELYDLALALAVAERVADLEQCFVNERKPLS